jgi:Arc/MetJ family transcription regulator
MRTTINIDEELLTRASEATGIKARTALINGGLRALIQRAAARELIALGGSDPNAEAAPRRRLE